MVVGILGQRELTNPHPSPLGRATAGLANALTVAKGIMLRAPQKHSSTVKWSPGARARLTCDVCMRASVPCSQYGMLVKTVAQQKRLLTATPPMTEDSSVGPIMLTPPMNLSPMLLLCSQAHHRQGTP